MSYFVDFQNQVNQRDFSKLLKLWEEYCASDSVDPEEFHDILKLIKKSEFAKPFGQLVESILPLLEMIPDPEQRYKVLKVIIDLQTTNTPVLAEKTIEALKSKYGAQPKFNERLRLIGMRAKENFQGALSHYDLLDHMEQGKFVFHDGGWGAGEIMEISHVREQLGVEFENVQGKKYITFANAFKTLVPLQNDHFLARRFADADKLEKDAKEKPLEVVKMLLRDLGPKTAGEIKDELCGIVIPEEEWTKWWQNVRAKLKKDTMVEAPASLKEPFYLRKSEIKHEDQFQGDLKKKQDPNQIILACYNFARDHTSALKKPDVAQSLKQTLQTLLESPSLTPSLQFQIALFYEIFFNEKLADSVEKQIKSVNNVESLLEEIEIVAFKKQAMIAIKEYREDWVALFLNLLFHISQTPLRDYLLQELNKGEPRKLLEEKLQKLVKHPSTHPELFVWYFQKVLADDNHQYIFGNKEGVHHCAEAFLILLSQIENIPSFKDLTKKMYNMLSAKRYVLVRELFDGASLDFVKEFLLLASKCHTLTDHDTKILRALAEVVHPNMGNKKDKKEKQVDMHTLWTTEKGYTTMKEKLSQIGTVEMVDNAREIEAARALGDLRENAEYKFALERRARLQGELKMLSEQMNRARILTKQDISSDEAGVGSIVEVKDKDGKKIKYTILGMWDADPEKNILSSQSKLALAMMGKRIGDSFEFKDEEFEVTDIKSFL